LALELCHLTLATMSEEKHLHDVETLLVTKSTYQAKKGVLS